MYLLRGTDDNGDPVDLPVEPCWRCGVPVVTSLVSMAEHVDRAHPVPTGTVAVAPEEPRELPSRAPIIGIPAPREPVDWWAPATPHRSP